MLSERELGLIKVAFSVGWYRALSESEYKGSNFSLERVQKETEEWLSEQARSNSSCTRADYLNDNY